MSDSETTHQVKVGEGRGGRHLGVGAEVGGTSGAGHLAYPEGEREGEGCRGRDLRGDWLGAAA